MAAMTMADRAPGEDVLGMYVEAHLDMAAKQIDRGAALRRVALREARGSTAQPSKSPLLQECQVAAEDQPYEILENGLLDRGAREFQRDALEAIDVDKRHGYDSRPIIDTKRDPRRDRVRD